jgi:cysteine desulfurase
MPKTPQTYLDHAASTPLAAEARAAMLAVWDSPAANASSLHRAGVLASRAVERARSQLAQRLGAEPQQLVFTSGGTESNNLAILGTALAGGRAGGHLIHSAIEHPSVVAPMRWLQRRGFALDVLPVDRQGRVDPGDLRRSLRPDTVLVSVIHGSNELGTVQDLEALGGVCREAGVPLHSDACQSFCKVPLSLRELPVDLLSVNAHKLHGPQGVGALWTRPGHRIEPTAHGGGQEGGLRSGTHNAAGIAGFGAAVEAFDDTRLERLRARRQQLTAGLRARFPWARFHGAPDGLPQVVSVAFPGADGRALFRGLGRAGFQISLGSACHATVTTASAALLASGVSAEDALSTLRISPGHDTAPDRIEALLDSLERLLPAR